MTAPRPNLRIIGAFAVIYLAWGSTYLSVALALDAMPPFFLMGTRSVAGGLVLLAGAAVSGSAITSARQWLRASVCGLLLFVGCHGVLAYAQQHVPSSLAAIMLATIPFWIGLVNTIVPGAERMRPRQLCLLVPGFAGVALVVLSQAEGNSGRWFTGDLLALLGSAASWAVGTVLSQRWSPKDAAVAFSGMELIAGGLVLLIISVLLGEPANLRAPSIVALAGWTYLTFVGTVAAFATYIWLLQQVSPTLVATYTFVNPMIAVFLGWAVLGERLTGTMGIGAVLVLVSVIALLAVRRTAPETPRLAQTQPRLAMTCRT